MPKAWSLLVIAGFLEIIWALALKESNGFTKLKPTLFMIVAMLLSFFLLGRAARDLPIGTAYAVWTGIGAAGTALVGLLALGESANPLRLLCIALILAGTIGLKFVAS